MNRPQWEKLWAGATSGAAGQELAYTAYAYDGQAVGLAPTQGNLTLTRAYSQMTPTAASIETTTVYDVYGRPVAVTDPNGHTTTTTYHPFYGYAQSVTNALNQSGYTTVDAGWGAPISVTDRNGRVTTLQYDAFGRLVKVWLPTEPTNGAPSREFVYAPEARPAWVKSRQLQDAGAGSYLESWSYGDGFGRSLQSQAPLANGNRRVTATAYDALGQVAYASAPYEAAGAAGSGYVAPAWSSLAHYTYTTYDELGRTLRVETRSGATQLWVTHTTYDGWTTSSYDANDHRRDTIVDAFGQTRQVVEYNLDGAYTTHYAYDLAGRLTGVADALGATTSISYDLLGRKTGMIDPDMGSWQYGYDSAGNLTSQRDGVGRWLHLAYDALNRLVRKRQDSPGGPMLAEWVYDAPGQLGLLSKSLAYSSQGATEVWNVAYDALNRPAQQQWSAPGGGVFRFDASYTTLGQRATLRYPGGNAGQPGELVTFGYNAVGQLNSVTGDDGTSYVTSTSYNAQGQVIEQRMDAGANGLTRQAVYNSNTLRLETLKAGAAAPFENLQKLTYTYDAAGNVQTLTDANNSGQVQSFGYDWLDRLTSAATNGVGVGQYSHSYSYDAVGNITSSNGNVYTYGDAAHRHAVTAAFGNSYGYDANGNQTSRTIGGVSYTFTYDYENRLTAIAGAGVDASFVYNAEGNRVKGTVNGVTTVYIAGIYEYQNGAATRYYEGGAMRRTGYASDNGVFYMLGNHLKSTSVLVNQNGTVNSRNYFYPFGGNRGGTAFSSLSTKRFTGQYHESSLPGGEGLSYYGAWWYDARVGRFLSADTLVSTPGNPQAFNRYSYVKNQPLNRIDPTGHADVVAPDGGAPPWRYSPSHYPPAGATVIGRRWSEYTAFWERATLTVGGVFDLGTPVGPNSRYGDGKSYSSMMARTESQLAIYCWFSEQCGSRLYFGPWTAITQEVKIDPQIEQVRMQWAEAGHKLPFVTATSIDNRDPQSPLGMRLAEGGILLGKEHGGLALDWVFASLGYGNPTAEGERDPTGYLGSFDRVSIRDAGNGRVLFEALNITGYASGLRIPGTNGLSSLQRPQEAWGPGGDFEQVYYWWESLPQK